MAFPAWRCFSRANIHEAWQAAQKENQELKQLTVELRDENRRLQEDAAKVPELERLVADLRDENERLQEELGKVHSLAEVVYPTHRNIFYSDQKECLQLYLEPNRRASAEGSSMAFGDCFAVAAEVDDDDDALWMKISIGDHKDKWVLARDAGLVNCVDMTKYPPLHDAGRIPPSEYKGQSFPTQLSTQGFGGLGDVCLVSASGDSFSEEISIEMLFRGIACAATFEQDRGGDNEPADWLTDYAVNCMQYGQLGAPSQKSLKVTVKPTSQWSRYSTGSCCGPDLNDVGDDLGKAQYEECDWLKCMKDKLHIKWDEVEFLTAVSFLRTHCAWTLDDCKKAANERLVWVFDNFFDGRPHADAQYKWNCAYWLWDEAFHGCTFEEQARKNAHERICRTSRFSARLEVPSHLRALHEVGAAPVDWAELAAAAMLPTGCVLMDGAGCLAAGAHHHLALVGTVLHAWGKDRVGQCNVPTLPAGEAWLALSAGQYHSLGLTANGALFAWGSDSFGQCSSAPVLTLKESWTAMSAGRWHSLGLTAEGTLHAWGNNHDGRCIVPALPTGERWAFASAGDVHSLGVTATGVLHAWGGDSNKECSGAPAGERWLVVSAGTGYSLGLATDGQLHAWGNDSSHQCSGSPTLPEGERWVAISAGYFHSLGLTSAGVVHAWGSNHYGECNTPKLPPGQGWLAVSAGYYFSLG